MGAFIQLTKLVVGSDQIARSKFRVSIRGMVQGAFVGQQRLHRRDVFLVGAMSPAAHGIKG